ncbi:phosphoribosyl-ATP pyrophosphohydrolase [Lysinibacillus sp. NPDC097195]|uniref:phosphoribosyl-ATP pyrophosphohydrolase n=1 Tax=Lysinibacillus sp. NPDC097195 TaxID=3364141 RepID=UPI00381495FF
MPVYNKLVRDKIIAIIEAKGLSYNASVLEPQDFLKAVKAKMIEEAKEFQEAQNVQDSVEELADILELVHTAMNALGISYNELEEVREHKRAKRGGFEKAIFLMDVEEK